MSLKLGIILKFICFYLLVWVVVSTRAEAEPWAVVKKSFFDAGSVQEGTQISYDFKILNFGDTALEILNAVPG